MSTKDIAMEPGVKDLTPLSARLYFAKALFAEREAGHTTQEALDYLAKAIEAQAKP